MARYSEAQKKATMKYIKNNYDEIKIRVPKGKKDEYKRLAESRGTSLTQLIVSLLDEEMNMEVTTMKELRNKYDTEIAIENLDEAKKYVMPDLTEFPEESEYAEDIEGAESLEELADVLNKYTDLFGNGSSWFVKEF